MTCADGSDQTGKAGPPDGRSAGARLAHMTLATLPRTRRRLLAKVSFRPRLEESGRAGDIEIAPGTGGFVHKITLTTYSLS